MSVTYETWVLALNVVFPVELLCFWCKLRTEHITPNLEVTYEYSMSPRCEA